MSISSGMLEAQASLNKTGTLTQVFTEPLYSALRADTCTVKTLIKNKEPYTSSLTRIMIKNCNCPWSTLPQSMQNIAPGTDGCCEAPTSGAPGPSQALFAVEYLSVLVVIQFQALLAVLLDKGPWYQCCHSHHEQFEQCVPGENGIQRGDL